MMTMTTTILIMMEEEPPFRCSWLFLSYQIDPPSCPVVLLISPSVAVFLVAFVGHRSWLFSPYQTYPPFHSTFQGSQSRMLVACLRGFRPSLAFRLRGENRPRTFRFPVVAMIRYFLCLLLLEQPRKMMLVVVVEELPLECHYQMTCLLAVAARIWLLRLKQPMKMMLVVVEELPLECHY